MPVRWNKEITCLSQYRDFQLTLPLPDEYQRLIRQAQETYQISVAPLQLLVGGWSGAVVYLVSVSANASGQVEHCILKLDRKKRSSKADEVTRHTNMLTKASSKFARQHIAELAFERLVVEGAIGIFYRIAGQSLLHYRPLSSYGQESQLKTIFAKTNAVLLAEWNADMPFVKAVHPQEILKKWLGFRLDLGGNIERFLQSVCGVRTEAALQWHTAAARWCWTCQKAAGSDPQRRGFLSKPGNRGCHLVNLHYAQRRRNLQLQPGIILN